MNGNPGSLPGRLQTRISHLRDRRGRQRVWRVEIVLARWGIWLRHDVILSCEASADQRPSESADGPCAGAVKCWATSYGRVAGVLYWLLKRILLGPILRLLFRPTVEGLENLPEDGPAILASNHLSFPDSIFLPLLVPRRITFLAKSDYFTGEGIKGRLTAAFFKGVGQLPVDRSGGRASEAALRSGPVSYTHPTLPPSGPG